MPREAPHGTLAGEGGHVYVGYRSPGGVTVRRPSGASERFSAGAASAALAEAVLSDRLGHAPKPQLVETFSREWVEARAGGEFVWPVVAVDEWLAAHDAGDARPTTATRSTRALRRTLEPAMTALHRSQTARRPRQAHSPRGGN